MVSTVSGPVRADEEKLACAWVDSPVGRLLLAGDERGLWVIRFVGGTRREAPAAWRESGSALAEAARQLEAWFAREIRQFDLALHPAGTEFQLQVWNALPGIPYGATVSYGELARRIGRPAAVRAVGAANGANPLPIVLPCHRVVGSDGSLTGYGGGLPVKARLLAMERGDLLF